MVRAVIVLGLVTEAGAWWLVAARNRNIWTTVIPVIATMGIAAIAFGAPPLALGASRATAAVAGLATGVALYLVTRAFVFVVRPWTAFREQATRIYRHGGALPPVFALLLSAGVAAVGEELFWRGLFQEQAVRGLHSPAVSALVTWGAFVVANLPSASLAVLAGAVVGGAAWGLLALWTKGVLASVLCHGVWTGLMLAFPVVRTDARGAAA
jgi:membrane protease YdiL (CAAX protease family)